MISQAAYPVEWVYGATFTGMATAVESSVPVGTRFPWSHLSSLAARATPRNTMWLPKSELLEVSLKGTTADVAA